MFDLSFDHYTLKVENLQTSVSFYRKVLGLREMKNRTQKEYIRWFSLGNGNELHIVEGETEGLQLNIGVHLALKLADFDDFIDHLKSHNITPHNSKGIPKNITTRADGVRQVYFQDPDGYWLEVNEAASA